jgi:hypothetical protein
VQLDVISVTPFFYTLISLVCIDGERESNWLTGTEAVAKLVLDKNPVPRVRLPRFKDRINHFLITGLWEIV